jgi:RDD family
MADVTDSLEDFPLHDGPPAAPALPERPVNAPARWLPAPMSTRLSAAAADAAIVLLLSAMAILAARVVTGRTPGLAGLAWAAGFLLYLSLFVTVPPLILFGRTPGMAIVDVAARPPSGGSGVPLSGALRRWLGTLATVATVGLPLLWTYRDPEAPTPADRISGYPLTVA